MSSAKSDDIDIHSSVLTEMSTSRNVLLKLYCEMDPFCEKDTEDGDLSCNLVWESDEINILKICVVCAQKTLENVLQSVRCGVSLHLWSIRIRHIISISKFRTKFASSIYYLFILCFDFISFAYNEPISKGLRILSK